MVDSTNEILSSLHLHLGCRLQAAGCRLQKEVHTALTNCIASTLCVSQLHLCEKHSSTLPEDCDSRHVVAADPSRLALQPPLCTDGLQQRADDGRDAWHLEEQVYRGLRCSVIISEGRDSDSWRYWANSDFSLSELRGRNGELSSRSQLRECGCVVRAAMCFTLVCGIRAETGCVLKRAPPRRVCGVWVEIENRLTDF